MKPDTNRLTLQPFSQKHFEEAYKLFTTDFIKEYLFDKHALSLDQAQAFLVGSQKSFDDKQYGLWMLTLKDQESLIGFVGLWHFYDEAQPQLIYTLLPDHTGQGHALEASFKVLGYALGQRKTHESMGVGTL